MRRTTSSMPSRRTSCMNRLVMPRSACQASSRLVRPPAAQADLDVAVRVDVALLDEVVHRRAVRELAPEDARAAVSVWVSKWTSPTGPPRCRAHALHVRLGDRVVAAEHDRHRAGPEHLEHGVLDRLVRADRIGRDDRCVAVVDDAEMVSSSRPSPRGGTRTSALPRGRRGGRGACPAGRRRARRTARRRWRRRRRRARPGPPCRAGPRSVSSPAQTAL